MVFTDDTDVVKHCFLLGLPELMLPRFGVSQPVALIMYEFLDEILQLLLVTVVTPINSLHFQGEELDTQGTGLWPSLSHRPFLF